MSATSKLVGFSATTDDSDESVGKGDLGRRRYLMRYVVVALTIAGIICVAAGVRVAMARSAAAQEDNVIRPVALGSLGAPTPTPPAQAALPAQATPPAAQAAPPAEPAPVAAAPAAAPVVAAAAAAPVVVAAPTPAKPTRAPSPPAQARPAAASSPARSQPHASSIVHAAPF
jgi:hypothetical protein